MIFIDSAGNKCMEICRGYIPGWLRFTVDSATVEIEPIVLERMAEFLGELQEGANGPSVYATGYSTPGHKVALEAEYREGVKHLLVSVVKGVDWTRPLGVIVLSPAQTEEFRRIVSGEIEVEVEG